MDQVMGNDPQRTFNFLEYLCWSPTGGRLVAIHAANVRVLPPPTVRSSTPKSCLSPTMPLSPDGAVMAIGAWGTGFVEALAPTPHK